MPNFSSHLCRPVGDCWQCQSGINKRQIRRRVPRPPRAACETPRHPGGFTLSLGLLLVPSATAQEGVKNIIIQPSSPLMAPFPWFSPQYYVSKEVLQPFYWCKCVSAYVSVSRADARVPAYEGTHALGARSTGAGLGCSRSSPIKPLQVSSSPFAACRTHWCANSQLVAALLCHFSCCIHGEPLINKNCIVPGRNFILLEGRLQKACAFFCWRLFCSGCCLLC